MRNPITDPDTFTLDEFHRNIDLPDPEVQTPPPIEGDVIDTDDLFREPVGEWAKDAACAAPDLDPDWWFPSSQDALHDTTRIAMAICGTCPVQQPCLEHALRTNEQHGIWGGKSERARRRLRASYLRRSA
jgi:WhiB family redox-sensing transcriptional regulator